MELSRISRDRAFALLSECTGDDIWSPAHCRSAGVPEDWIEQLGDVYESGFDDDRRTIYVKNQVTNHYSGVRDIDLARQLGRSLGVEVDSVTATAISRCAFVAAIKAYLMDGE